MKYVSLITLLVLIGGCSTLPDKGVSLHVTATQDAGVYQVETGKADEICQIRYIGRNGFWPAKAILWVALWLPAWWVAESEFEATYQITHGERIGIGVLSVRLDDFDCGFRPFQMFMMPRCMSSTDWARVVGRMVPEARCRALLTLHEEAAR